MLTRRYFFILGGTAIITLAVLTGFLSFLLVRTDEWRLYDPDVVNSAEDQLWGGAFGQNRSGYKLARTISLAPDLLIVGSSRVTQIRAEMLPGAKAYNAGGAAASLDGAEAFLNAVYAHHHPRLLVLGVDPWWFWPEARGLTAEQRAQALSLNRLEIIANLIDQLSPRLLASILQSRPSLDPLGGRQTVGWRAASLASGFRPDGSDQYGNLILGKDGFDPDTTFPRDFRFYRQAIRDGNDRFGYSGPLSAASLSGLDRILNKARNLGIKVVVLVPPFPHAIWQELSDHPRQRQFQAAAIDALTDASRRHGAEIHVIRDLAELGLDDSFTLDGIHVDEIATLRQMLQVIDNSPSLQSHIDIPAMGDLRKLSGQAGEMSRHTVFR